MKKFMLISIMVFAPPLLHANENEVNSPQSIHQKIHSISLDKTVEIAPKAGPYAQTPGQIWGGAIGGAVGAAITTSGAVNSTDQYRLFLEKNEIDIKEIVLSSFRKSLESKFSSLQPSDSKNDARLSLLVTFYGIHPSGPFSRKMEPVLAVKATIISNEGTPLWSDSESIRFPSSEDVTPHYMDEYVSAPNLLRDGYQSLSNIIADSILNKFIASQSE